MTLRERKLQCPKSQQPWEEVEAGAEDGAGDKEDSSSLNATTMYVSVYCTVGKWLLVLFVRKVVWMTTEMRKRTFLI